MEYWKQTLSALTGVQPSDEPAEQTVVEKNKRVGVVYSTNPDYAYDDDTQPQTATLPKNQQKLRLSMERTGRGGKTVTIVRGFVGTDEDMAALCKLLKQKCGVGGAVKDGEIIIQGDKRPMLLNILKQEGYTQTK